MVLILGATVNFVIIDNDEKDGDGVGNHPPDAILEAPEFYKVTLNEPAMFSAANSTDDDGDELTFLWEFHDGTTYDTAVIYHTYTEYFGNTEDDTHSVLLTVFDKESNDTIPFSITVLPPEDTEPAIVTLESSSIPYPEIAYIIEVEYISEGDANIRNISYQLVSAKTGEELGNGTVFEADVGAPSATVSYINNYDDYMESYEYFKILAEPLNATEGDYFYLYHIPTRVKMGEVQLSG